MPPTTSQDGVPGQSTAKISQALPDIESILTLNPKKNEHAKVLPTAGPIFITKYHTECMIQ